MPMIELTTSVSIALEYTGLKAMENQIHARLRQPSALRASARRLGQEMLVQAASKWNGRIWRNEEPPFSASVW